MFIEVCLKELKRAECRLNKTSKNGIYRKSAKLKLKNVAAFQLSGQSQVQDVSSIFMHTTLECFCHIFFLVQNSKRATVEEC